MLAGVNMASIGTYKCNDGPQMGENKTQRSKVEEQKPDWMISKLYILVVVCHDASAGEVSQDEAAELDEETLGDLTPWRMAGSKMRRLHS